LTSAADERSVCLVSVATFAPALPGALFLSDLVTADAVVAGERRRADARRSCLQNAFTP
jgi:hypothetical protein